MGATITDFDWKQIASVAAVAGVYSILTSIATGLPEVIEEDGILDIDTTSPDKDVYNLRLNEDPALLGEKKTVSFKVKSKN